MADKCIRGTMLEFMGKRRWRASKDSSWGTVQKGQVCGKLVGTRLIDGVRVGVIKDAAGKFYAERVPNNASTPVENVAQVGQAASTVATSVAGTSKPEGSQ